MSKQDLRPFYIVFAGVNGAGKSTLYRSGLWRSADIPEKMARVNPDEIVRELGGSWRNTSDQLRAGRVALKRIDELFEKRTSFTHETTLAGRSSVQRIKHAHDLGYRVFLYYVGVESPHIALRRIAHRVEVGGHDIGERVVQRRFTASLSGLASVLDFCEHITVFDNTRVFTCIMEWSRGMLSWWGNPQVNGPWLLDAMQDENVWRVR
ncbi:zeta toxin family protein [Adlercreutzia sp. ZJ138]|uniref:zeta toxin family protein n=1 Tax=Adlercreutzia sp. ZJ138 TaxID=2709405 RepID=UPI0013ECC3E2|nr:zeta toxin family protein [Adlercreutzia sp. ZJ138]